MVVLSLLCAVGADLAKASAPPPTALVWWLGAASAVTGFTAACLLTAMFAALVAEADEAAVAGQRAAYNTALATAAIAAEKSDSEGKLEGAEWQAEYNRRIRAMEDRVAKALPDSTVLPWMQYAAYTCDAQGLPVDNLDEVAVPGVETYYVEGPGPEEPWRRLAFAPTWLELAVMAAAEPSVDADHVLFEGLRPAGSWNGRPRYRVCMGS